MNIWVWKWVLEYVMLYHTSPNMFKTRNNLQWLSRCCYLQWRSCKRYIRVSRPLRGPHSNRRQPPWGSTRPRRRRLQHCNKRYKNIFITLKKFIFYFFFGFSHLIANKSYFNGKILKPTHFDILSQDLTRRLDLIKNRIFLIVILVKRLLNNMYLV